MYKIKYFLSETPYSSIIIKYKYYKNGVIQEEANLINGIFQGKAIKNYPTGKLKMELNYLNDELEGKAVYYYEDGNIEEFYYEKGELRESWKSFL